MFRSKLTEQLYEDFVNDSGLNKNILLPEQVFFADLESKEVMLMHNLYETSEVDDGVVGTKVETEGDFSFIVNLS